MLSDELIVPELNKFVKILHRRKFLSAAVIVLCFPPHVLGYICALKEIKFSHL